MEGMKCSPRFKFYPASHPSEIGTGFPLELCDFWKLKTGQLNCPVSIKREAGGGVHRLTSTPGTSTEQAWGHVDIQGEGCSGPHRSMPLSRGTPKPNLLSRFDTQLLPRPAPNRVVPLIRSTAARCLSRGASRSSKSTDHSFSSGSPPASVRSPPSGVAPRNF